MLRFFFPTFVICTSVLLSACQVSPLDVTTNVVDGDALSAKPTFAVQAHSERPGAYLDMITSSVEKMLDQKGYQVSETPDVVIVYQVRFIEGTELEVKSVPVKSMLYSLPVLESVYEAKILINAVDASNGRVLWKAAGLRDLTQVGAGPYSAERADKAVESLFDTYPQFGAKTD